MDSCHSKKCGAGATIAEVQRQSRAPGGHCKRRLWSLRIAKLPGCDGQAADAVSAHTQVKNLRMLQDCSKSPNQNVQMFGHVFKTQMAHIMGKMEDPVVPLERNLYDHPSTRLLWERQFEEALLEVG